MAIINIPVGGGTFTANSGDVFNIAPGATGNITINGATDFTVNITGSLTGGVTDNLRTLQFGTGSQPTVNIAAGADTRPCAPDAHHQCRTPKIGDGASLRDNDGNNLDATISLARRLFSPPLRSEQIAYSPVLAADRG